MNHSPSVCRPICRHISRPTTDRACRSPFGGVATLLVVLLTWLAALPATATHIRAGDIQAVSDPQNLLRYTFTMRLYLDPNGIPQPNVDICFGDGTSGNFPLFRQDILPVCQEQVLKNTYKFTHVFPGPGLYEVAFTGNNRNASILNLGSAPSMLGFYISTTLRIDASTGPNNSAVLNSIPIDQGVKNVPFYHSPAASDSSATEHDSLSFELAVPRQGSLMAPPDSCAPAFDIPTYTPLDQYAIAPGIFRMDPFTGLITWASPGIVGVFNIAYLVKEWRHLGGIYYRLVGITRRDMQIVITPSTNKPPIVQRPNDTCVVAGTTINRVITAIDPDGVGVRLFGEGGPFVATPPATLTPLPGSSVDTVKARFLWTPTCRSVAQQPYLATITARDTTKGCESQLNTIGVWQIKVVGPAPTNLQTQNVTVQQIGLSWDSYGCGAFADSIRIYRREDSSSWTPGPCETGIPRGLGYVLVGTVAATTKSFVDTNGGQRFKFGTTYCYRIYATWPLPAGGESIASNEACAATPGLLPQLINATVDATDTTAGKVTVRWTHGNHGNLPAIYVSQYRLSRAAADAPTAFTILRDHVRFDDTTFVDTNLDTERRQYIYRLEFILLNINGAVEEAVDVTPLATTPRLEGQRTVDQISLTWAYAVPWNNTTRAHYIYRRINGNFELIDTVQAGATGGSYVDRFTFGGIPIEKEAVNCYRILTRGTYQIGTRDVALTDNYSQEQCVKREPCPPGSSGSLGGLVLTPADCAADAQTCPITFSNELSWTADTASACATDLMSWRLYFQPTAGAPFGLLATLPVTQLAYSHGPLTSRIGCYYLTAVDSAGTESKPSNTVCQDNCDFFTLPNIITPNGDHLNDTFEPICASPLRHTTFVVYNRWGVKVYESDQHPRIEWPGTATGGQLLADGTYFYRAEVEFDTNAAPRRYYKGWVQIVGGRETSASGK